jgi:hypothetical protein
MGGIRLENSWYITSGVSVGQNAGVGRCKVPAGVKAGTFIFQLIRFGLGLGGNMAGDRKMTISMKSPQYQNSGNGIQTQMTLTFTSRKEG